MNTKWLLLIVPSVTAVGFTGGMIFEKVRQNDRIKYLGNLRIDKSEPNEPEKMFLELETGIDILKHGDTAVFRVIRKNYIA